MKTTLKLIVPAVFLAGCNSTTGTVTSFRSTTTTPTTITSGGPTTITSGSGSSGPVYETLESTKAGVTTLAGVSLTADQSGNMPVANASNGSLDRTSGAFSLNDGYDLNDPDGVALNKLTDGNAVLKLLSSGSNYRYMAPYSMTYTENAEEHVVMGVYGNPTRTEDLPSAGSADYSGEAIVAYRNKTGVPFTHTGVGRASIKADFANSTVDVESRFIFMKDSNGNTVFNPAFNKIDRTGMQISGGTFSGGTAVFTKDGTVVDPIGANAQSNSRGQFFGGEAAGGGTRPAEVAGVSSYQGDDARILNVFFGD